MASRGIACWARRPHGGCMSRSLIVLPDDSARPILNAIHAAEKSIRVKMFVFSDPDLLKAIVAAHRSRRQGPGHA